jgi:hypothetical protein
MKKLVLFCLSAMLIISNISMVRAEETSAPWDGTIDTSWYNSTDTTFVLSTPAMFVGLAKIVAGTASEIARDGFGGKTVRLSADMNMNNLPLEPVGNGGVGYSFLGTFDGDGHVIKNVMLVNDQNRGEVGLFSRLDGENSAGLIKNLGVSDITLSCNIGKLASTTGGLVGYVRRGRIENCFVRNVTISDSFLATADATIGAFVGLLRGAVIDSYAVNFAVAEGISYSKLSCGIANADNSWNNLSVMGFYSGGYNSSLEDFTISGAGSTSAPSAVQNCYYDTVETIASGAMGVKLSSADMKAAASVLGGGFMDNESDGYNNGYPLLLWEEIEEEEETEEPPVDAAPLEIVEQTDSKIVFAEIADAWYCTLGGQWQQTPVFENLTSGYYHFYYRIGDEGEPVLGASTLVGDFTNKFNVWNGTEDTSWYDENEAVYKIYTPEQFAGLSRLSRSTAVNNFNGKTIVLMSNLDMDNRVFEPIGYGARFFGGVFDGNGHIVKNIRIEAVASDAELGLFGRLDGTLKNLGVDGIRIRTTGSHASRYQVGGMVGYARYATIQQCFVRNVKFESLSSIVGYMGSFVGYVRGGTIEKCYATNISIETADIDLLALSAFAGHVIESGGISACYVADVIGFAHYSFAGFAQGTVAVSACYTTVEGNVSGLGTKVISDDLKELKYLNGVFRPPVSATYNNGYPLCAWEEIDRVTVQSFSIDQSADKAYAQISGFKNNRNEPMQFVFSFVLYEDEYMTKTNFMIVDVPEYGFMGETLSLDLDVPRDKDYQLSALLYQSCEMPIPLMRNVEVSSEI